MTNESDTALIARVAEKLGWVLKFLPALGEQVWGGFPNEDKFYELDKLPSTDACLALTGEPEGLELWKDDTGWNCSYPKGEKTGTFAHGEPNRPRAILLALLEVE